MKKILLGALAFAAMTSCMKDQVVSSPESSAIAFEGAFVEKVHQSRAAVDPSTTTGSIDAFDVWGFMKEPNGIVFDAQRVTRTGTVQGTDKGIWTYSPLAYWAPEQTYYFAALAPVDNANIQVTMANGKLMSEKGALGTVTFTNTDGKVDLLYAQPAPITTGKDVISTEPAKVGLEFAHLLSKVKFTFKNGFKNPYNSLEVKNIKLEVPTNGYVDLTQDARPYLWTVTDLTNTVELSFGDVINNTDETKKALLDITEAGLCAEENLTIPVQSSTTIVPNLIVSFDVVLYQGDQPAITTRKQSVIELKGEQKGLEKGLEQGRAYHFIATIDHTNILDGELKPIEFDVKVNDWAETVEYDGGVIETETL